VVVVVRADAPAPQPSAWTGGGDHARRCDLPRLDPSRAGGAHRGSKRYYPTGRRNFARIVPADDVQAAAGVNYAGDSTPVGRSFSNDGTIYGLGIAAGVQTAADLAEMEASGTATWRASARH
jgi:hypothetical protein